MASFSQRVLNLTEGIANDIKLLFTDLISVKNEIIEARGSRTTLNKRITTISNFASPNAGGVISGQYYDNAFNGTASSTLAGAANRWDMVPYFTSSDIPINRIGCLVSTAVVGSLFKIQIYDTGDDGWPSDLLLETGDLSGAATGYSGETVSFNFEAGRQYWLGVRHSSTCTLRVIAVASAPNLGLTSATATTYATVLRRTLAYATPSETPYVFSSTYRAVNIKPPSIRFRAQ